MKTKVNAPIFSNNYPNSDITFFWKMKNHKEFDVKKKKFKT